MIVDGGKEKIYHKLLIISKIMKHAHSIFRDYQIFGFRILSI
jgi:hypothetical protein